MSRNRDEELPRIDAPPWERQCRLLDGHGGFYDSKDIKAALEAHAPRCGTHSTPANALAKSGMTRRGVVYEYIRAHPGAHVRGIANDLHLATGDLQYHLDWLEKHGLVKTRRSGFYRFVYPTMVFQERQEVLLGVLTQATPREILLSLLLDPAITQGGLARSLGHSQPTISWHLERMVRTGLVSKKKTGSGTVYHVVVERDEIVSFVRSYHQDVWKRWAGRLATASVGEAGKGVVKGGSIGRAGLMPPAVVKPIGNG
jgi:DNA-binding MarR family transcriptional regulator